VVEDIWDLKQKAVLSVLRIQMKENSMKNEQKLHYVKKVYPGFEESSETKFKLRFPEIMRFS
jgi:hypothetical protein